MFMIKTRLAPSSIEGLGVFADEDVPQGTVVWKFVSPVDCLIDPDEMQMLPPAMVDHCQRYAYFQKDIGKYVLCGDDARFVNHADDPNTVGVYPPGEGTGLDVAARDIKSGEELTCDYKSFDAEFEQKMQLEQRQHAKSGAYTNGAYG